MRWSPYIEGQWIARVPADHACRTITGWMKWNEMDEMSVETWWNEICGRGKLKKPWEKPTQTSFHPPRNPHGVTETRAQDPSGGRRAANCLRHEAATSLSWLILFSHLILGLPTGRFLSGFPTSSFHAPLSFLIRVTCPAHRSLRDVTILIISGFT